MRYFIDLQYDGKAYCGWQRQPDQPTVQGTIEDALTKLLRQPTEIVGAGRTDTGVNASFYVAHFDSTEAIDEGHIVHKLNAMLPHDIAVKSIYKVADDLHARFDAVEREYTYLLSPVKSPFRRHSAWICYYTLDIEKMNEAAKYLLEVEDFTTFAKLNSNNKTNICDVKYAEWTTEDDGTLRFTIRADRFLRNMVRSIVGTLVDVGRDRYTVEDFRKIVDSKDLSQASSGAPPQGLFLSNVKYKGQMQ